jgi:hypothetical protein
MDQPMAAQSLASLEPLVGEWTLEATGPDGVAWPGEGRAVFEWHSSGAHLIQRASIDVPGAPASVSIIGCDAANGTFVQLYSDERGVCRIFSMRLDGAEWTLERAGELFHSGSWGRSARMPGRSRVAGKKPKTVRFRR